MKVAPGGQPRLLEDRLQALSRGARVGGRLEDDELVLGEHGCERPPGVGDIAQIRLALVGERGGHADQDRVAAGQRGVIGRRSKAPIQRRQTPRRHVLDLAAAAGQALDDPRIDVDAADVVSGLGEDDGPGEGRRSRAR